MNNSTLTLTIRANVSALQAALKTAQASVKNFSSNVGKKLVGNAANLKDAFSQAGGFIESTLKRVAAVAVGGSFGLMSFVKSASELQSLRSSFESLTGSVESTNVVMKTLYQYGKETAFDNKSIQATAKMFLANGVAVQDLMGWMRNLGDLAGATGADLQGLALPITQAIGTGKMMTQDWYQIINQGAGGFKKYIIAAMGAGHSIKTFGDDLSKGKVTADVLRKALQMASAEGGMAFQGAIKQSRTFNGRMSNLLETITNVGMKIVGVDAATGQVKAGGVFDKISKAVEDATNWLEENKDTVQKVADVVINNFVPAATAAGAALVAMKLGTVAAGMLQFASAIRGGKTAMEAFNLVTGKNPMLLIVGVIAAVISALVFLQMKFNIFGKAAEWIKNTWNDSINSIKGFLESAGNTVKNVAESVGKFFDDAKKAVSDFGQAVADWFITKFEEAKKIAGDVFNAITKWINDNKTLLINLGIVIGTIVLPKLVQIGIEAAKSFAVMAKNAAVKGAGMAAEIAKSLAKTVVSATVNASKMAIQGAIAFGSWIKNAAIASAGAIKNFVLMSGKAVIHAGIMGVQGAIAFGKWTAGAVLMGAKAVATFVMMGVQALVAGARIAASWLMAMGPIGAIVAVVAGVVALIIANWDTVKKWLTDFWNGVVAAAQGAWNGIVSAFNAVVGFFSGLFQGAWNAIVAVWNAVIGFFANVWNGIVIVFSAVVGWFGGIFAGAWNIIVSVWNAAAGWFGGVWNGIVGVFAGVAGWFGGIFRGAWNAITGIFGGLAGFFGGVWNTITGMFGRLGSFVGNAIGGAVRGAVNGALSMVEKMANGFIGMINGAIGIINKIPGVHIGNIPSLHIPRMATGGIVTPQGGGSIIYAGDGGQNEWVVPESKMASLVAQINRRSDGVGARDVNITVNVTTRDEKFSEEDAVNIAKQINRALKAQGLRLDQLGALR